MHRSNSPAALLYLLDVLAAFHTGFVVRHDVRQALVLRPALVARYYVRHGSFLSDVVASE